MALQAPTVVDQEPDLLTVTEVAKRLRVSQHTVHRWARDGALPYVSLPAGMKRFRREDIEAIETTRITGRRAESCATSPGAEPRITPTITDPPSSPDDGGSAMSTTRIRGKGSR